MKKANNTNKHGYFSERDIRWDKLDNTANLFPVIAGEDLTNVYRISVTLKEMIKPEVLQMALDMVLPKMKSFNVRLRQGIFWYYFEENGKNAPKVKKEDDYPCRFIVQNKNRNYMFRVSYYEKRINLEVFHVLTDGMGGINFLKELTYQYLRLVHPKLREEMGDALTSDTSLNTEDSFLKNYKKGSDIVYKTKKAYLIKGEKRKKGEFGVMHVYLDIPQLKKVCKKHNTSINEFLVAVMAYSIYTEELKGMPSTRPLRIAVPVNLRPYFNSITTKNFFAMVSAEFHPQKEAYTFEEVLLIIKTSLKAQINKEHLEKLFSYNVSNEKNLMARAVPLILKNIAILYVYTISALANTTTVTNVGNVTLKSEYEPYVEGFCAFISVSKGQFIKGTICSYQDTLVYTFSSILKDVSIQKAFCRLLQQQGLDVKLESNGVYYE